MANNEVIDGNLTVGGTFSLTGATTVSALTVTNAAVFNGTVSLAGTSILTANSTSVTIAGGTSQGASVGTINAQRGRLTTELCTAGAATVYQVVVTNTTVSISDVIMATLVSGAVTTTSNFGAFLQNVTMSNGSFVVNIRTLSAANAPFTIDFFVVH